ncbi:hypothetical protein K456DRAFT_1447340 [Colletotrichum gloeosporioides 23]|nr:hypothetical protein K456DRAFT_1447340 [Colletotrichum gloeosporioides 23]
MFRLGKYAPSWKDVVTALSRVSDTLSVSLCVYLSLNYSVTCQPNTGVLRNIRIGSWWVLAGPHERYKTFPPSQRQSTYQVVGVGHTGNRWSRIRPCIITTPPFQVKLSGAHHHVHVNSTSGVGVGVRDGSLFGLIIAFTSGFMTAFFWFLEFYHVKRGVSELALSAALRKFR